MRLFGMTTRFCPAGDEPAVMSFSFTLRVNYLEIRQWNLVQYSSINECIEMSVFYLISIKIYQKILLLLFLLKQSLFFEEIHT